MIRGIDCSPSGEASRRPFLRGLDQLQPSVPRQQTYDILFRHLVQQRIVSFAEIIEVLGLRYVRSVRLTPFR